MPALRLSCPRHAHLCADTFVPSRFRHGASSAAGQACQWLDEADKSLLAAFARGLDKDQPAVAAALTEPWSDGQTEGQINRLKTLKRSMYGRANIDLLKARLVAVS